MVCEPPSRARPRRLSIFDLIIDLCWGIVFARRHMPTGQVGQGDAASFQSPVAERTSVFRVTGGGRRTPPPPASRSLNPRVVCASRASDNSAVDQQQNNGAEDRGQSPKRTLTQVSPTMCETHSCHRWLNRVRYLLEIARHIGHVDGGVLVFRRYQHLFPDAFELAQHRLDHLVTAGSVRDPEPPSVRETPKQATRRDGRTWDRSG